MVDQAEYLSRAGGRAHERSIARLEEHTTIYRAVRRGNLGGSGSRT